MLSALLLYGGDPELLSPHTQVKKNEKKLKNRKSSEKKLERFQKSERGRSKKKEKNCGACGGAYSEEYEEKTHTYVGAV